MKQIEIYTDGACRGNPGPGGYGAVLKYREQLIEPCEITLYSDSRYLVDAISKRWLANWRRRGWIKADRQPVLNVDLWRRLEEAMAPHRLKFVWVRGHASNAENNRCDELAVAESRKFR